MRLDQNVLSSHQQRADHQCFQQCLMPNTLVLVIFSIECISQQPRKKIEQFWSDEIKISSTQQIYRGLRQILVLEIWPFLFEVLNFSVYLTIS